MRTAAPMQCFFRVLLVATLLCLTGCAGALSLPGGDENNNSATYASPNDFLSRLNSLQPGMNEQTVFIQLGHNSAELTKLQKTEILQALYGSNNVEFRSGQLGIDTQSLFLQSLYGYSLNFKNVQRNMGFSGLFRIRTDESGYDYTVTLIFREGKLYARPIVTGGIVNKSTSKTLFDYLTPGMVVNRIK